jgi:FtsH-binding integral membrane protein
MGLFSRSYQPISNSVAYEDAFSKNAFLQKVYSLFFVGLIMGAVGAVVTLSNPEILQLVAQHPIITLILFVGMTFGVMAVRKVPVINIIALLGFTFLSGAWLAPLVAVSVAQTGSFNTIFEALGITGSIFIGLTAYVFISQKDFTFMGGFIMVGLFSMIGLGIIGFFIHSTIFELALAWIGAVLFSLFILYDTSRIMHSHQSDEYVAATLGLYLDFINLFVDIAMILMNGGRRR